MFVNCIFIRGVQLPAKIRGSVVMVQDDFFVYVNTVLSPECQQRAARHELQHIRKDHFYDQEPVVVNELEAQG